MVKLSISRTILLGAVLLTGCGWKPSAPPLQDGPVYSDARERFRFFVPTGWKQRARGEVPPGKILTERMLAEYRCLACAGPGMLMVTVMDVPESTTLGDYLAKNTLTGEKWREAAPAETFAINGVPAARVKHTMGTGKDELIREVIAFRRGERVYFFKGHYASADTKSAKAIQGAVDTVVW